MIMRECVAPLCVNLGMSMSVSGRIERAIIRGMFMSVLRSLAEPFPMR
jgi:hypothetical protein